MSGSRGSMPSLFGVYCNILLPFIELIVANTHQTFSLGWRPSEISRVNPDFHESLLLTLTNSLPANATRFLMAVGHDKAKLRKST